MTVRRWPFANKVGFYNNKKLALAKYVHICKKCWVFAKTLGVCKNLRICKKNWAFGKRLGVCQKISLLQKRWAFENNLHICKTRLDDCKKKLGVFKKT